MKSFIYFSACFVFFVLSVQINAQVGVNSISGSVFNDVRRPVGQAYVELLTEYYSPVQRTQTNQSGHYSFTRVNYGRYIVRVRAYGTNLLEQERGVDIYNMSGSPTRSMPMYEQVDFYLQARKSEGDIKGITGVVFAQEIPQSARDIFSGVKEGDTSDAAIDGLKKALQIFPKYHDALVRLGMIYIGRENYTGAVETFNKVIEVNPSGFAGWYGLGYSQFSLNDPASLATLKKAIEIDKTSVNAWFIYGMAQRKSKNYEEALSSLLQAQKLDDDATADISWNIALLYYHNLKKPIEAADQLEKYLKIAKNPKNKEQVKVLIKKFRSDAPYE